MLSCGVMAGAVVKRVDFDLHGLVGIRLQNASGGDVAAVRRQLGPMRAELDREPDILIRFVERLPEADGLRLLGVDEAAYTDDEFVVLRGKQKSRVMVRFPFEVVGERCEIVCATGLAAVPLLVPVINLTLLSKGVVALHASAFVYRGTGVLVTGWAKGGKTETLLGFMAAGADYVGDEWVYLRPGDHRMFGIPEPIRVWDWHLTDVPQYRARLSRGERARLRVTSWASAGADALWRGVGDRQATARATRTARSMLRQQVYVQMPPSRLFGSHACALEGTVHQVFFVVSHESSQVRTEPIDARDVARRMVFSNQYERQDLRAVYLHFRFAFPARANRLLEHSEERERELLCEALDGLPANVIYHPYPAPVLGMYRSIEPLVRHEAAQAAGTT